MMAQKSSKHLWEQNCLITNHHTTTNEIISANFFFHLQMAAPLYQVQVGSSYSSGFKNGNRSGQDEVYSTVVQVKVMQELVLLAFLV